MLIELMSCCINSEAAEGKEKWGSKRGRSWRARERQPITEVWGRSPSGIQGQSPQSGGQGANPPEVEKPFAFRSPLEAANLPLFSLYCRLSKSLTFSIKHWQWG